MRIKVLGSAAEAIGGTPAHQVIERGKRFLDLCMLVPGVLPVEINIVGLYRPAYVAPACTSCCRNGPSIVLNKSIGINFLWRSLQTFSHVKSARQKDRTGTAWSHKGYHFGLDHQK
jgi:hypothetical protein